MSTNDPKGKRASYERAHRYEAAEERNSFRRDDSRSSHEEEASAFFKDRRPRTDRPRIGRYERNDRDDRRPRAEADEPRRHSYNPNFTRDNRRVDARRNEDRPRFERSFDRQGGGSDTRRERSRRDDYRTSASWEDRRGGYARRDEESENSAREGGYRRQSGREGARWSTAHCEDAREGWKRDGVPRKGEGRNGRYNKKDRKRGFPTYDKDNYPRFEPAQPTGAIRLNRFIANSGICSRREADDLIQAGVVSVNGQIVTELGTKVNPTDEVRFNGEIIRGEKKVYILMNKPRGYVTSLEDPHADKTVMDLLKDACKERVYPVGRLDKNSVGVLLFTNDGELTRQLTHPSYSKKKIYQVTLNKSVTQADMQRLADGIELEDGMIYADEISYVGDSHKEVGIEIHSGRNRIVRRMFEALGYTVQKLDRVYFGGLTKKKLKRGAWRFLTPMEVNRLKSGEYE